MSSQVERLKEVLSDGCWHDTPDILLKVYGAEHLGIARVSARVYDLSKKLSSNQSIESRKKKGSKTIFEYRILTVEVHPASFDLFSGTVGESA